MRRIIVTVVVALLGLMSAACGAGVSQVAPLGEEPVAHVVSPEAEPVYVINLYGAEDGRPDQRPANLVVSEFSTLKGITWRSWGPGRAVGSGKLSGTWCLPACQTNPYDATITLSKVKKVGGKRYFTRFDIGGDFPQPDSFDDTLRGALPLPLSTS
ncbi:hypothetical protein AB0395_08490 [Streptosporangium sp. NPDC051023]|uniref:hypothetical protein n=1 Tax=Streptosporangium sp. NPDC051023 TaxID=3155410 RepID=UPI00344BCE6B